MAKSFFSINRALTPEQISARRRSLARLGLAWLVMMQVMMFALPGYLRRDAYMHDDLDVMDKAITFMSWISLCMTIPVLLYCAWPIWRGAMRAMSRHHMTMDVPVAISIAASFFPSMYATFTGQGEVYYDSVTMFIAFLLTARFFEERARMAVDDEQFGSALEALRAPLMQYADRIAFWFVIVQLSIAAVVGAWWWGTSPEYALSVTVSLLVMSCPCALSLATPVSLAATHATLGACPDMTPAQMQKLFAGTRRVSLQNLYGSLIFHLITTPLAAVGLVTPWLAAIAMFVSSMVVILNAWRLYRMPAPDQQKNAAVVAG